MAPMEPMNQTDWIVRLGIHLLESLFFTGLLGSLFVVLLSAAEDVRGFLRKDESA